MTTHAAAEDVARLERTYGIDRTIPMQYIAWAFGEDWLPATDTWHSGRCLNEADTCGRGIVRMDFGRSFQGQRIVIDVIVERIPATFLLAFPACS